MHTMDKETAITEARQRFKAWRCRPDSCSVPPLNLQRTNFNFEPIVPSHRFAIPFSGGYCIQLYKKLARCLIESATPVRLEIVRITSPKGCCTYGESVFAPVGRGTPGHPDRGRQRHERQEDSPFAGTRPVRHQQGDQTQHVGSRPTRASPTGRTGRSV